MLQFIFQIVVQKSLSPKIFQRGLQRNIRVYMSAVKLKDLSLSSESVCRLRLNFCTRYSKSKARVKPNSSDFDSLSVKIEKLHGAFHIHFCSTCVDKCTFKFFRTLYCKYVLGKTARFQFLFRFLDAFFSVQRLRYFEKLIIC